MNLLGEYTNGNYNVHIFDDGTKIRENDLDNLTPSFPENIDLKITDYCDRGCLFCHENSTTKGIHGDILNQEFIDTIKPFTELALGGGNPLDHPDLVEFLKKLRSKNILANITVNQKHFVDNKKYVDFLVSEKLIYGLGVSVTEVTDELLDLLKENPNIVIHVIYGVITEEEFKKLYDNNLKVLILGYKIFRRGEIWLSRKEEEFSVNSKWLFDELGEATKHFRVVSFDNLAIRQLEVKRLMSESDWNNFYMGDDGQYTMYIDMVKKEFASSSTSMNRQLILDNIEDMFNVVRAE